jgi:hypothetical protein
MNSQLKELKNRHAKKTCAVGSGPKNAGAVLYWTVRQLSSGRWVFEDAWAFFKRADTAARFYRRTYRKRCVVVAVEAGKNKNVVLKLLLEGHGQ